MCHFYFDYILFFLILRVGLILPFQRLQFQITWYLVVPFFFFPLESDNK